MSGILEGDESTWPMTTSCTGEVCKVQVRRELESGAYENFTLDEVEDRTSVGTSTGTIKCIRPSASK